MQFLLIFAHFLNLYFIFLLSLSFQIFYCSLDSYPSFLLQKRLLVLLDLLRWGDWHLQQPCSKLLKVQKFDILARKRFPESFINALYESGVRFQRGPEHRSFEFTIVENEGVFGRHLIVWLPIKFLKQVAYEFNILITTCDKENAGHHIPDLVPEEGVSLDRYAEKTQPIVVVE